MRQIVLLLLLLLNAHVLLAQIGGNGVYQFLNINTSARVAALGGNQIAVKDNDPFLALANPALLNHEMDNKLAMTYTGYLADVGMGFASYTKDYDSLGTFSAGLQFVDYGQFDETDNAGNDLGNYSAGEYALIIGYARPLDTNFSIGLNLKAIHSSFYDYTSNGVAADVALNYFSQKRQIDLALVVRNIGTQISTYAEEGEREKLPFEIQLGFSKRLKNVPIRFGIIAQQLQKWDLTFNDLTPNNTGLIDNVDVTGTNERSFPNQVARHMIFNAEFLVTRNFNLRLGYNLMRRAELKIDEKLGTVGLSWGLGFRINKFHFSYGRSAYHQAGATNTLSVSTRLIDFIQ